MAAVSILQKAQNYTAYRGEKNYAWAILLKDKILKGKNLEAILKNGGKTLNGAEGAEDFFHSRRRRRRKFSFGAEGAGEFFSLTPKMGQ